MHVHTHTHIHTEVEKDIDRLIHIERQRKLPRNCIQTAFGVFKHSFSIYADAGSCDIISRIMTKLSIAVAALTVSAGEEIPSFQQQLDLKEPPHLC